MSKQSAYTLTLNCHPNDTQLFEDWLILIKNWLNEDSHIGNYSWSIEMDDSIHRHLHLYFECTGWKDNSKVYDRLKTKEFKNIHILMKDSKTIFKTACKISKVTETPKQALGYTQKWNNCRRGHKGFTDDEILEAIEYYYTVTRLEKAEDKSSDWKHVTNKNFHAIVEDFVSKDPDIKGFRDSDLIKLKMVRNKHTFQLSVKDQERYFKELRVAHNDEIKGDSSSLSNEVFGMDKNYDNYMEEDIKELLKYIKQNKESSKLEITPGIYQISLRYSNWMDDNTIEE